MDKPILRLLIQERLADGRLPHDDIPRVWGGPGNGETCYGCGETVTKAQRLIGGLDATGSGVRFHRACFHVWSVERKVSGRKLSSRAQSASAAIPSRLDT
jgi:hypothetical protein